MSDIIIHTFVLGLLDGINRRNLDVLERALHSAKSSEHEYKLRDRIKEADELREHLMTLKKFAHDVLEMKQTTISELHRYSIPPPLILGVMKATFLLLGEPSHHLQVCVLLYVPFRNYLHMWRHT